MTDLQGWQKVAREIGDYDSGTKYIGSGDYVGDMQRVTDADCIGDWLPAEAAAKEILRLREALEAEHRKGVANLMEMARIMNREVAALREIIHEVAASGVEQDVGKYVVVQISAETWRQVQAADEQQQETDR